MLFGPASDPDIEAAWGELTRQAHELYGQRRARQFVREASVRLQRELRRNRISSKGAIIAAIGALGASFFNFPSSNNMGTPAKKRIRFDEEGDTDMESPSNEVALVTTAARSSSVAASSAEGATRANSETKITIANPTYGLPNTHTCILPVTFWCSAYAMDKNSAATMQINLNQPFDMMLNALETTGPTAGFNAKLLNILNGSGPLTYQGSQPETLTSAKTIVPAWYRHFATLYEYYTVLGCEYEMYMQICQQGTGAAVVVGTRLESEGVSGSTALIPNNIRFAEALALPGWRWKSLNQYNGNQGNDQGLISGSYKPGDIKREVRNDDDQKLWTAVGVSPTLKDRLKVQVWAHPFSNWAGTSLGVNFQVTLKYIVQFKDLRVEAKYPTKAHATNIDVVWPDDAVPINT